MGGGHVGVCESQEGKMKCKFSLWTTFPHAVPLSVFKMKASKAFILKGIISVTVIVIGVNDDF